MHGDLLGIQRPAKVLGHLNGPSICQILQHHSQEPKPPSSLLHTFTPTAFVALSCMCPPAPIRLLALHEADAWRTLMFQIQTLCMLRSQHVKWPDPLPGGTLGLAWAGRPHLSRPTDASQAQRLSAALSSLCALMPLDPHKFMVSPRQLSSWTHEKASEAGRGAGTSNDLVFSIARPLSRVQERSCNLVCDL